MASVLAELHLSRVRRLCCVVCMVLGRPTINGVKKVAARDLPVCEEVHHIEKERHEFSDFLVLPCATSTTRGTPGCMAGIGSGLRSCTGSPRSSCWVW